MIHIVRVSRDPLVELKLGSGDHAERRHAHAEWSLSIVLTGRTTINVGGCRRVLRAGSCVAIPSGVPHLCTPTSTLPFAFAAMYLDPRWCAEMGLPDSLLCRVSAGRLQARNVQPLLNTFFGGGPATEIGSRLRDLLHGGAMTALSDAPQQPDGIGGLNGEIDPGGPGVANTIGDLTRYQIYRRTRRRFFVGAHALRQIRRVERAKELLREGWSVADVAAEVGFYDQSHLVKTFRLYTGTTPRRFSLGVRANAAVGAHNFTMPM